MSYEQYRDRELKYYQDRVYQLEQENLALRTQRGEPLHFQQVEHREDPYANSILGTHPLT